MRGINREPLPAEYDSYEEWEKDHNAWEDAMEDYCEEYLEEQRGLR